MLVFLASLAMFFVGAIIMIVIVSGPRGLQSRTVLPSMLFVSTALLLGTSLTLHLASKAVQRERQLELRLWLLGSVGLGGTFCFVQSIGLAQLLLQHQLAPGMARAPGLLFALAGLHALHVLGGLIAVLLVTISAYRGQLDHESYSSLKLSCIYWHFMDVVWLLMLGVFLTLY